MLAAWDATYARDSAAAAMYATWAAAPRRRSAMRRGRSPNDSRCTRASLARAIDQLTKSQGADWSGWRWGRMHTRPFPHSLTPAFNLQTVERPGGAGTVAADGASYREILDVADWDRSIVTNVPGQSAQPESPYFSNLLKLWADDVYFPLAFSRARVLAEKGQTLVIRP